MIRARHNVRTPYGAAADRGTPGSPARMSRLTVSGTSTRASSPAVIG